MQNRPAPLAEEQKESQVEAPALNPSQLEKVRIDQSIADLEPQCTISLKSFTECNHPVIANDGYIYEAEHVKTWARQHNRGPVKRDDAIRPIIEGSTHLRDIQNLIVLLKEQYEMLNVKNSSLGEACDQTQKELALLYSQYDQLIEKNKKYHNYLIMIKEKHLAQRKESAELLTSKDADIANLRNQLNDKDAQINLLQTQVHELHIKTHESQNNDLPTSHKSRASLQQHALAANLETININQEATNKKQDSMLRLLSQLATKIEYMHSQQNGLGTSSRHMLFPQKPLTFLGTASAHCEHSAAQVEKPEEKQESQSQHSLRSFRNN